jgi:hypothetical protein
MPGRNPALADVASVPIALRGRSLIQVSKATAQDSENRGRRKKQNH